MTAESSWKAATWPCLGRRGQDRRTTRPSLRGPYSWMRNGGLVDEEYDDSDDAKEQGHWKPSWPARVPKAKGACRGLFARGAPSQTGREDVNITPVFDVIMGDLSFISLTLGIACAGAAVAPQVAAHAGQAAV